MFDPEERKALESLSADFEGSAKILLVEDTPFFMKLTRGYLESAGYEVIEAWNGLQALDVLKNEDVDLVISDINMPLIDDYKLIENIRRDKKLKDLPVIALTALSDEKYKIKALAMSFDAYEVKINKARYSQKLKSFLRKKQLLREEDISEKKRIYFR